jgi:hypothetical protein
MHVLLIILSEISADFSLEGWSGAMDRNSMGATGAMPPSRGARPVLNPGREGSMGMLRWPYLDLRGGETRGYREWGMEEEGMEVCTVQVGGGKGLRSGGGSARSQGDTGHAERHEGG